MGRCPRSVCETVVDLALTRRQSFDTLDKVRIGFGPDNYLSTQPRAFISSVRANPPPFRRTHSPPLAPPVAAGHGRHDDAGRVLCGGSRFRGSRLESRRTGRNHRSISVYADPAGYVDVHRIRSGSPGLDQTRRKEDHGGRASSWQRGDDALDHVGGADSPGACDVGTDLGPLGHLVRRFALHSRLPANHHHGHRLSVGRLRAQCGDPRRGQRPYRDVDALDRSRAERCSGPVVPLRIRVGDARRGVGYGNLTRRVGGLGSGLLPPRQERVGSALAVPAAPRPDVRQDPVDRLAHVPDAAFRRPDARVH